MEEDSSLMVFKPIPTPPKIPALKSKSQATDVCSSRHQIAIKVKTI